MMDSQQILCAGRIYCDLVFTGLDDAPRPGREVYADGLKICAGGGAYITAAYLAALGETVGLVGMLPAAPFETVVKEEMQQNNVWSFCEPTKGLDAQLTAALVTGPDRAFVTRRVSAAVPQQKIDDLPSAKHLHIGELTTALEHPDLISAARQRGMTISLDCSWDGQTITRSDLSDLIAKIDIFLPNEDEAKALKRHKTRVEPKLATIIKQGDKGATAIMADSATLHTPVASVQVVDTTGAGDAFNAGFLSAWLAGSSWEEALELGNACGRTAVARVGGAGQLPDLSALRRVGFSAQAAQ